MQNEMIQFAAEHLGVTITVSSIVVVTVFNAGINWSNFRYMKRSMVTKKDLEIALLQRDKELDEKFLTKDDAKMMFGKANGKGRPHHA